MENNRLDETTMCLELAPWHPLYLYTRKCSVQNCFNWNN